MRRDVSRCPMASAPRRPKLRPSDDRTLRSKTMDSQRDTSDEVRAGGFLKPELALCFYLILAAFAYLIH